MYLELSSSTGSSAAKAIELNDITTIMKKSKYRKFTTQWAARRILKKRNSVSFFLILHKLHIKKIISLRVSGGQNKH